MERLGTAFCDCFMQWRLVCSIRKCSIFDICVSIFSHVVQRKIVHSCFTKVAYVVYMLFVSVCCFWGENNVHFMNYKKWSQCWVAKSSEIPNILRRFQQFLRYDRERMGNWLGAIINQFQMSKENLIESGFEPKTVNHCKPGNRELRPEDSALGHSRENICPLQGLAIHNNSLWSLSKKVLNPLKQRATYTTLL